MRSVVLIGLSVFLGISSFSFGDTASPLCASYQVPSASPELAAYSKFQISRFSALLVDGKRVVKYTLPQDLTGEPLEVSFTGPADQADPDKLSGPNGDMNCAGDVCQVKFHDLAIDDVKVDQFLHSSGLSTTDLMLKTNVARNFKSDPGGVFSYEACGL